MGRSHGKVGNGSPGTSRRGICCGLEPRRAPGWERWARQSRPDLEKLMDSRIKICIRSIRVKHWILRGNDLIEGKLVTWRDLITRSVVASTLHL